MTVTIAGFDLKPYAIIGGYKINQNEVFKEWTDGRGTNHRDVIRTQVAGTMKVMFKDISDYDTFLTALDNGKLQSGAYSCELTVNNKTEAVECECYLTFTPVRTQSGAGVDQLEQFDITVEER